MLTIKEVASRVGESEHTIRYYCKVGLFPFLVRDKNNVRKFTENDLEGVIKNCEIYFSNDPTNWGEPVCKEAFEADASEKTVTLPRVVKARYFRFVAKSEAFGRNYASVAEFDIIAK